MRILATLLLTLLLGAQATSAQEKPAAPAEEKPKPAEAAPPAQPTPAAEPAAAEGERLITGSIEAGYRWIPNIDGSFNTYRSVVNLGEGPKLFGADFTIRDPKRRAFDRAEIHATTFGGDPYSTLRIDLERERTYRLSVDYRNISYFNFLPSYADPTLTRGILLDQNSFDTHLRSTDVLLDILPGRWLTPYLAFSRNTQFGRGITVFTTNLNEFPVAALYSEETNNYRGGVRIDVKKYHLTLEQGGTTFKDDQGASEAQLNSGNLTTPFLGQRLFLNNLSELYSVRGDSYYTKALLAANPVPWANIAGEFIFSQPTTSTQFNALSNGNFYLASLARFFTTGRDILTADAKLPHTAGSINLEIRPLPRLRILEYWMTDRLHNASNSLLTENLIFGGSPLTTSQLSSDRLALNYSQQEIDVLYDLTPRLTLKGGYRYAWGDSRVRAPVLTNLALESGNLSRHVAIGGFTFRMSSKLRIIADAEGSSSEQSYFRTSLRDYQKARIRGTYDFSPSLRFTGDFSLLFNNDPDPKVRFDFSSKTESVSAFWTPKGGKLINVLADYTRSSVRSNLLYLIPQVLSPAQSIYRENGHTGTAAVGIKWFSFGGSFFKSSGSRPTSYYQPLVRVSVPIYKHVQWNAEWRYYGMHERFYQYENFRSNQVMASLRFTL